MRGFTMGSYFLLTKLEKTGLASYFEKSWEDICWLPSYHKQAGAEFS